MSENRPLLAITMGDPAGIGPEIIAKAVKDGDVHEVCRPVIIGDPEMMRRAAEIVGASATMRVVDRLDDCGSDPGVIEILPAGASTRVEFGKVSAAGGRAAYAALEYAARLALGRSIAGIVTAPLNKEGLAQAGWVGVGHTELLARLCGTPEDQVAMLLASEKLKIAHVSTHVALRQAIDLVTSARVATTARLAARATERMLGRAPRLAVAGLNPHAGESGLFGLEDREQIAPAVELLSREGWNVSGPLPPDTVFLRACSGEFDVVVAMYHDQGHIPAKLSGLTETVNVTLGLPIIRTSVDHGTAYDIAGTGKADARNLGRAILLAAALAAGAKTRSRQ
jgi:4-hydroxythreonine-4-phosphate dehydrogenase